MDSYAILDVAPD